MRGLVCVFLLSAIAVAATGHIYNLDDGGVTVVKYSQWRGDHGPLKAKMPSGELLKGEYSITRHGSVGWGSIYGSVYGSASLVGMSIRGEGMAILTGDKGTVLNCEFISSGHGSGACSDNHGVKYKLLF